MIKIIILGSRLILVINGEKRLDLSKVYIPAMLMTSGKWIDINKIVINKDRSSES